MIQGIFLDDVRTLDMVYPFHNIDKFYIVRTVDEFVSLIGEIGVPDFISFDNDLGSDSDGNTLLEGYDAAKWLVYESGFDISSLKFEVHSSNPVAKKMILSLLSNYIDFLNAEGEVLGNAEKNKI